MPKIGLLSTPIFRSQKRIRRQQKQGQNLSRMCLFLLSCKFIGIKLFITFPFILLKSVESVVVSPLSFLTLAICVFFPSSVWLEVYQVCHSSQKTSFWFHSLFFVFNYIDFFIGLYYFLFSSLYLIWSPFSNFLRCRQTVVIYLRSFFFF